MVPASYTLTVPTGGPLDQADVEAIRAMATAKQWTNEEAQAALTEMSDELTAQSTRFRTQLDADPEIGGTQLEQAQVHATRALDRFLPSTTEEGAAFRMAMAKSGYGNYAPFVKLLARIGKAMSEDAPVIGGPPGGARRSAADVLFGDAVAPGT